MYEAKECDILVIGGGGAGVTAAVIASRAGACVALVSKEPVGRGDTCIASGIMADGSVNPSDEPNRLIRDLVLCGERVNDPSLVSVLARRSGEATEVLEQFGMVFHRDSEGRPVPMPFPLGGHSMQRSLVTLSEGNQIGTALRGALFGSSVNVYEEFLVTDLFTEAGSVTGALGLDLHSGKFVGWSAGAVILASGGCGWLFAPFTSNMKSNTGDGFVLAFEAGAELRDMEHAQFTFGISHPRGMTGVLAGEPATAGFFGRLLDGEGEEIIEHPGRRTRGQVSTAMARAIAEEKTGPFGGVFLDLAGNVQRMGHTYREILALGRRSALDAVQFAYGRAEAACKVPWEVIPTFHYHPGGVRVDERCQSTVSGLYAIGQVMGGLFGADRLGSVSLTELFLFGKIAGESALQEVLNRPRGHLDKARVEEKVKEKACLKGTQGAVRPVELKRRLQTLMRQKVGFFREKDGLEEAIWELDRLDKEKEYVRVLPYENFNTDWIDCLELSTMIRLGRIIARCALEREESRGGHLRIDHPERDDGRWLKTLVVRKAEGAILLRGDSLEGIWDHIEPRRRMEEARPRIREILLRTLPDVLVQRIMRKRMKRFL